MIETYKPGFVYTIEHIGVDGKIKSVEKVHNLMPTVAVNYLLTAGFLGGSAYTSWYVSVYGANRTPLAADTMTTLLADCQENTVYTVTGGARPIITWPAVSSGVLTNTAAPNILEFPSSSTVRGVFVTTNVTRGNNSGLLMSAALLESPKSLITGEALRVYAGFALVAV